jgi:hypothetical protein
MTKKIKCNNYFKKSEKVKVRIIKAPLVDTKELRDIIFARTRAIVL